MGVDEINRVLIKALEGDTSVSLDADSMDEEYRELAHTVNTAIKKLEKAKEAEIYKKRLIAFIKQNPQAIAVLVKDKSRIDLNKEYQRVWRGSYDELMAKKLYDFDVTITGGDDFYASFETKKNACTEMEVSWPDGVKRNLRLFQTPLLDENGEIDVNYYIYQDLTAEVALNKYLSTEIDKISENIEKISKGNLDIDLTVGESDEYTHNAAEMIHKISNSINDAKTAIENLITDVESLSDSAITGDLSKRADSSGYEGHFKGVIDGFNQTLDMIEGPLREAMKVVELYAENDYRVRFSDKVPVAGDFAEFKDSINELGDKLVAVIGEVRNAVDNVNHGTVEITRGSDEVAKATEQVAMTSQKCADINRGVLMKMENIQRQIAELSASNEEIAATSQSVLKNAENVATMGSEAQVLGNDANMKMESVQDITSKSVEEIKDLNEQIKEINNIVKMINEITGQINLLSLNAAIEAARAGEHGRGFAVVAGEVKNLAADARKATDHIENVISSIQKNSRETASAIQEANSSVQSAVVSVNATIKALYEIVGESQQVTTDMGEIARAIENQANIANIVVGATDDGAKQTGESLKEVEELAALAEETSASVEEIGSAIHEVNSMVNSLTENMNNFKV
ncbi:MAG: methyl-accepting chemotaxis protein [Methanomicrobium sp.]|nr:methyl-accepting chemotaxis protein [Methanomicrobium sp.]